MLCVIHQSGQNLLDRCNGIAAGLGVGTRCKVGNAPSSGPACTELILSTPNAASNPQQAIGQVTAYLQAHQGVHAVMTLNNAIGDALVATHPTAKVATFDLDTTVENDLKAGTLDFAVDQQQYLQGYLPIVFLYLYNKPRGQLDRRRGDRRQRAAPRRQVEHRQGRRGDQGRRRLISQARGRARARPRVRGIETMTDITAAAPTPGPRPAAGGADERLARISRFTSVLQRPELGALIGAIFVFVLFAITDSTRQSPVADPDRARGLEPAGGVLRDHGGAGGPADDRRASSISPPGVMTGVTAIVMALLVGNWHWNAWLAILGTFAFAALIGLINGVVVVPSRSCRASSSRSRRSSSSAASSVGGVLPREHGEHAGDGLDDPNAPG